MANEPGGDVQQPSRDRLALTRTRLANERTMLAYARTAIMLAATGGSLLLIYGESTLTVLIGWALVAAAVGVITFGLRRFRKLARSLDF